MIQFLESRVSSIAPNVCEVVGRNCAAKILAAAGGLEELARTPACNIQVMGSTRGGNLGLAKKGQSMYFGFFGELNEVKEAPPKFQIKLVKRLANGCSKASRIDFSGLDPLGEKGKRMREDIMKKFEKIQLPQGTRKVKKLKIDDKPKRRRGGKKYRKLKEKTQLTQIRKLKNRVTFNGEAQYEDYQTGKSFGQLKKSFIGNLKVEKKKQKQNLTQKQQKVLQHRIHQGNGTTTGLVSSLVFAPNQGIELVNPEFVNNYFKQKNDESEYFKKDAGFKTVLKEKSGKIFQDS